MSTALDINRRLVLEGRAFVRSWSEEPQAGDIGAVQLWNPQGSGVRLFLIDILASIDSLSTVSARTSSIALAVLGTNGVNRLVGGAASVAEIRTESSVTGPSGSGAFALQINANTPLRFQMNDLPLVLSEGTGLSITTAEPDKIVTTHFQWLEI